MKKLLLLIYMAIFTTLLIACQTGSKTEVDDGSNGGVVEASEDEIVETHGSIQNIERLDQFVQNVQNQTTDKVQLIRHTIEGDPIYHKYEYDGKTLGLTIDSSKDKFGSGEIYYFECKTIKKQESNIETKYILEGCPEPATRDILTIFHNVDREDYFGFSLKFGESKENIINTKDQKVELDLGNGQKIVTDDFHFSTEEMNEIFKLMIFANYLQEKDLTNKCEDEKAKKYDLTVWINSAEKHFVWDSCDKGNDGKEMSKLVENIVNLTKNSENYQSLLKEK